MVNNKDITVQRLKLLNLEHDEARLYLELLKEPASHLKLARATGINRSKVYRLADQLEKRSLISARSDDRGTFLIAADPATLEIELVAQEEKTKSQRAAFETLLPVLQKIKNNDTSSFIIHTYEGIEGFKQMLWHELRAQEENLVFGCGSLNELVDNRRWIEQHQARMVQAGYRIRELINPGERDKTFSVAKTALQRYQYRIISENILSLQNQIVVYNDTVGIYHWRQQQKVGLEIISTSYANTTRQMFEFYWKIAQSY